MSAQHTRMGFMEFLSRTLDCTANENGIEGANWATLIIEAAPPDEPDAIVEVEHVYPVHSDIPHEPTLWCNETGHAVCLCHCDAKVTILSDRVIQVVHNLTVAADEQ